MNHLNKVMLAIFYLFFASMLSGCALLNIPGQIIGGTFGLLGQLLKVIGSMPKPPPWVF